MPEVKMVISVFNFPQKQQLKLREDQWPFSFKPLDKCVLREVHTHSTIEIHHFIIAQSLTIQTEHQRTLNTSPKRQSQGKGISNAKTKGVD